MHSFRQTSITGWRDWYTHSNTAPLLLLHGPGILLLCFLTWFLSTLQVAVVLHVGGSGEHLYLLCHLLCCPAGVGKWAAPFLQVSLGHSLSFIAVMSMVVHTDGSFHPNFCLRSKFGGTAVECSTLCKLWPF